MSEGTERASGLLKTGGGKEQSLKKRDTQIRKRKRNQEKKQQPHNRQTVSRVSRVGGGSRDHRQKFFLFKNLLVLVLFLPLQKSPSSTSKNVLQKCSFKNLFRKSSPLSLRFEI